METKIPFSGRGHQYTEEEIIAAVEAMRTADPLTQGKYRNAFEEKFAQYIKVPYAFSVCNATAALEMAAQLLNLEAGDEVIAPTHTFTASVYPFLKKGASVLWADIDANTRVVTAQTIEPLITEFTKAIIVVHLYGFCADMPPIMELARKHGLLVIEDVAQAMGTQFQGQQAGSFGDFGVFSLHSHKNITTLGEGGFLTVKEGKYAQVIPMIRHNGHCDFDFERPNYWTPAMSNVDLPELDGKPLLPNNYCLGEVECAVGSKLLDRLDQMNREKRSRAMRFIDALSDFPQLVFHKEDSIRHNYHLLVAKLTGGKRDEFLKIMSEEKGVKCVVQYIPLHRYDLYKKLGFGVAHCPESEQFFDNMVSFPFQHWMSEDDFEYMIEATRETMAKLM